nr:Chain C, 9-mer peptide from Matrix protein 1 [Influenza B virus]
ALIGASICF